MDLQFQFNGTVVKHPDNWRAFEAVIERSEDLLGLVNMYSSKLTFSGDAYDAIVSSIQTNGFCEPIDALVQIRTSPNSGWTDLIDGIIFPTECDFDRTQCTVKVEINDKSYISKIQNNQKIKAHIEVPRSKNDATITEAQYADSDFFTPSTGVLDYPDRQTYSVDEVLRFLVAFMTDGTVGYASGVFGAGGIYENWRITTGEELRVGGGADHPYTSFYDVIQELNKKTPLGFGIEDSGGVPTIRIEDKAYFRNEAVTAFTAREIRGLKMTFRENEIYSKIKLGGTNTQAEDGVYTYPDIPFYNFKEEEYHLLGECNVENELDLVGDWIVDSNVIEDILINDNDQYDKEIVLFMAQSDNPVKYEDFTPSGGAERVYNIPFTNQGVAERYLGFIPNSIAQFLGITGTGTTGIDVHRQTVTTHTLGLGGVYDEEPAEHNVVDFTDGNYTASPDYRYTASAIGYYRFFSRLEFLITSITSGGEITATIEAKHFNAGGTNLGTKNILEAFSFGGTHVVFLDFFFVMAPGDYVHLAYHFARISGTITFDITTASIWQSTYIVNLGGVVQDYEPSDYHIYDFTTEGYPMALSEYLSLFANPAGVFLLNQGSDTANDIITFADRIVYRPFNGNCDLQSFSKYNGF